MYTGYHYLDIHTVLAERGETTGINIAINGANYPSPLSCTLPAGTYISNCESIIYRDGVKYQFDKWADGSVENPRSIVLYGDMELTALYEPWYTLSISVYYYPSNSGITYPSPATYEYRRGTIEIVTAVANAGFHFNHWCLDGTCIYGVNPITVTMNADHSLTAHFWPDSGGGGGDPCPVLFVWNGSGYMEYGVVNLHNPSGEDVIREIPIPAREVAVNGYTIALRLREGWPGLNFSESVVDQVKLYALDAYGNRYPCPLINAVHNTHENVLLQLLFSDNYKTRILLNETINLTFFTPYPTTQTQNYLFKIEGCNQLKP